MRRNEVKHVQVESTPIRCCVCGTIGQCHPVAARRDDAGSWTATEYEQPESWREFNISHRASGHLFLGSVKVCGVCMVKMNYFAAMPLPKDGAA